jgi:hypothetical protein
MQKPDPNQYLETPFTITRLADYPSGPNTSACEDSVEVSNGVMTYVRFSYDIYSYILHQKERKIDHPDFPFPSTMMIAYNSNSFSKPTMLPFNSKTSLNGCQHLYKNQLYFHSENFLDGTKKLLIGNIDNGKIKEAPFYGDNPFVNKDNPNLIYFDRESDIWVAQKGWFSWSTYNLNDFHKINLNTTGEENQPYYTNGEIYYTKNYKEIWKYNIKDKTYTLLVKLKDNNTIIAIGEPSFDKKLYFLVVYKTVTPDGNQYDADIVEGQK